MIQNKHQAGKTSTCFTWDRCQIYLAPSYMLRPPHKISGVNDKTYLQTACAKHSNSTGNSRSRTNNLQPTQKPFTPEPTIHHADHDLAPVNEPQSNIICAMLFPSESLWSYSYQTGKNPIKSSRGDLYIFILYHYDTNTIQHPFLTGKLQPFAMHGNPPIKH